MAARPVEIDASEGQDARSGHRKHVFARTNRLDGQERVRASSAGFEGS